MLEFPAEALALGCATHVEYLGRINYFILQHRVQLIARREISEVKGNLKHIAYIPFLFRVDIPPS